MEANGLKFADSTRFRVSKAIGSHVVGKVFEESRGFMGPGSDVHDGCPCDAEEVGSWKFS